MTFSSSRHRRLHFFAALGCILLALGFTTSADAETTSASGGTQITAIPFTISTPGTYYLQSNFTTSSNTQAPITVSTSGGVTIDLNGHTITNTYGAAGVTGAIIATNQANITIRNGTIIGFDYGVYLNYTGSSYDATCSSYGHLIENVNFVQCTYCAAKLVGVGCRIYRCRAILTGGTTTTNMYESFKLWGTGNSIEDSEVSGKSGSSSITAYGITISVTSGNFVLNNRISGVDVGVRTSSGGGYKYRDNLTSGVTTSYTGGTDAGNNN